MSNICMDNKVLYLCWQPRDKLCCGPAQVGWPLLNQVAAGSSLVRGLYSYLTFGPLILLNKDGPADLR
jgi:hypothetical protein